MVAADLVLWWRKNRVSAVGRAHQAREGPHPLRVARYLPVVAKHAIACERADVGQPLTGPGVRAAELVATKRPFESIGDEF